MALRDIQSAFRRQGTPAVIGIIVVSIIVFIITFASVNADIERYIAFIPANFAAQPWTVLTYPFAAGVRSVGFISVLFGCWWLYGIGGTVERELGTAKFVAFWAVMTIIPALLIWAVTPFLPPMLARVVSIMFMFLPLGGVTVAWATRNPNSTILFMMVIPILAKWVGWITVGMILFGYGAIHPWIGFAASIHLGIAYLFAANKIPFLAYSGTSVFTRRREGWKPIEKNDKYFADVKRREIEREERERLRKLFEGSLNDDPEDKR